MLVGLGESGEYHTVRVQWPSGRVERWFNLPLDQYSVLREGAGQAIPVSSAL